MAGTENGALSFKALMDTGQITEAIKQTIGQIRDLSDVAVAEGQLMNSEFVKTSTGIRQALAMLGEAYHDLEKSLGDLKEEYLQLVAESNSLSSERAAECSSIAETRKLLAGEIVMRERVLAEIQELTDILDKKAEKIEVDSKKIEENANAHRTLRQRIFDVKEAMHQLINDGISPQSEEYKAVSEELGRLRNIQRDIERQGTILSNDQSNFQGIISGLSGVAGGLSAATGAMALFGDENEDLQKVMTKVQSVMAIAIGMQQVSQTLNKNSAFQLVTLNKLKAWWAKIVAQAARAEAAGTAATLSNTTAKKAQVITTTQSTITQGANTAATIAHSIAAKIGAIANLGLAGSFRAIGLAIKSIPVFGWIAAGITAIVALLARFLSKAKEAKKAQKEFTNEMVEGCYKPIGALGQLSHSYAKLGNDLKAKEKFINENREAFEKLGVKIRSVADAQNLLIKNKDAFIDAQIAKARALAYTKLNEEKVADILKKEEEYNKMPDTVTDYRTIDASTSFGIQTFETPNKKKEQLREEIERMKKELRNGYESVQVENEKVTESLEKAGIKMIDETVEGSVKAIEESISEWQEKLKDVTNSAEAAPILEEIKKLEERKENILGKKNSKKEKEKDPFIEQLEKKKKAYSEYVKWINSDDEKVRSAANKQFSGLLKEGNSYIDYLKKQREQLLSVGNRSQEQNKNLASLNKAIAEESKKTLLDVFKDALKAQIDGIDAVLDKIDKIKELKENLSEDDPLKAQKTEVLDEAMGTMVNKAKEETQTLYKEYADYYDKKVALHKKYLNDIALLEEAKKNAKTDKEKDKIDRTIKVRKERHDEDIKKIDGYDEMIAAYGTFEQKKQAIIEDFEEKRKKARERGDQEMIKSLDKAQGEAVSKLSLDELIKNPDWSKMFENLDEIATEELERLQAMIEEKKISLGAELSPKDFEVIMERLKAMKAEIKERNPFKGLIQSVKDYSSATDSVSKKSSLTNMFSSTAESIGLVKGAFDAVVDGIKNMGIQMDAETEKILSDIGSILDGAGQLAAGIASGNPLDIIKGSIGLFTSAMDLLNTKDRDAQRSIRRNQKAVRNLERAYVDLSRSIDRALGSDKYNKQKEAINNLRQQEAHLREMERSEREKKKSNEDKVQEYQDKQKELQRKQQDIINGMRDDIIGMDAKTAAEQLGDAFISAFARGEDAVKAFGKKTDEIVANIMKKMLIQKLLEQPIGKIIDKYSKKWIDEKGNFSGFDSVNEDAEAMGEELKGLAEGFQKAGGKFMEKLGSMMSVGDTTLTGAVKGVTEETAGIVAGQLNAIRIRQSESADLLRQQLMHLSEIASNTRYNKHLESIDRKLSSTGNDSLRSKGASHV